MQGNMLFTTMVSHRPVMMMSRRVDTSAPAPAHAPGPAPGPAYNNNIPQLKSRKFRATAARDPTDRSINNPNNPPPSTLKMVLARSSQPTFSVSAMFGVKSGGGCGACGH